MTSRSDRNELSSTLRTVANLQTVYNHNENLHLLGKRPVLKPELRVTGGFRMEVK